MSRCAPETQRHLFASFVEPASSMSTLEKNPVLGNVRTLKAAQRLVRVFARQRGWEDVPNLDMFDHLHEELIEMSQYLRYKDTAARLETVAKNKDVFVDGIGDLLFGICRLANQLDVDKDDAFNQAAECIFRKSREGGREMKLISSLQDVSSRK